MIIHREIGLSYHQKCIVQGVNYSPLMVGSKEDVLVKEEKWPKATPAVIPPLIFLRRLAPASILFLMFLCCLLLGTPRGGFN
jgi:hypothetical protein